MAMRVECKHFQSRTYSSGEVARFCVLGNAPDQPWACPDNCLTFEPRLADVGWNHGTLRGTTTEPAPEGAPEDRREVLESAADIVNAVAPTLFSQRRAELEEMARRNDRRGWKFWKR
jgi:hypothetical protein